MAGRTYSGSDGQMVGQTVGWSVGRSGGRRVGRSDGQSEGRPVGRSNVRMQAGALANAPTAWGKGPWARMTRACGNGPIGPWAVCLTHRALALYMRVPWRAGLANGTNYTWPHPWQSQSLSQRMRGRHENTRSLPAVCRRRVAACPIQRLARISAQGKTQQTTCSPQ